MAETRCEEKLLPLTAEYAPPLGDDDQGGYRINAAGIEQLAFVWLRNRYVMPGDVKGDASGEQFGSDDAERYAKLFAAAPAILEALQAAQKRLEQIDDNCPPAVAVRLQIGAALEKVAR